VDDSTHVLDRGGQDVRITEIPDDPLDRRVARLDQRE
jgi:hypothetical protein